jgi:L-ribulose-5-phosphate 3-epimerase
MKRNILGDPNIFSSIVAGDFKCQPQLKRRTFVLSAAAAALPLRAQPSHRFVKSICSIIFPDSVPITERFQQARNAGFDAIEVRFGEEIRADSSSDEVRRIADAAAKTRISIASLWVSSAIAANPLNSPDPEKRVRGVETLRRALEVAHGLHCGAILVVPGRLGSGAKMQVGYEEMWQRVTAEFRKLIPHAAEEKVILTPENVWNKFLVSPLEMRTFIDQFSSPWLQAHFDVGNVMQFGYPQDWIHVLGRRIKRVHFKDYKLSVRAEQGRFVDLLEGDVDWKAVMTALTDVDYRGTISPEYEYDPADPDKIRKVSQAVDKILGMV